MRRYSLLISILTCVGFTACGDIAPDGSEPLMSVDDQSAPIEQAVTSADNLIPPAQAPLTKDTDSDGAADGFAKVPGSGNTVTFSVANPNGQTIKISAATGSADASVNFKTFLTPSDSSKVDAAVDVKLIAAGGVGARLDVLYYNGTQYVSRVSSPLYKLSSTPTTPVYKRIVVAPHFVPNTATKMKLALVVVHLAAKTTGQATFRNVGVASVFCYSGAGTSCGYCGGIFQCDGQCHFPAYPPPAEYGQDCGCGNTWQCDGSCSGGSAIPAEYQQPCGCGGRVQCNGTCSIPCPL